MSVESQPEPRAPQSAEAVRDESAAARSGSVLFDFARGQLELTGGDRAKFLHNFCTNDIRKLTAGQGTEAFVTSVQGKVLGHVFVYAVENALWVDAVAGNEQRLLPHLSRYQITEDVEFHDRTADLTSLLVAGPTAGDVLRRLGIDVASLPPLGHATHTWQNEAILVRRNDLLNLAGFQLVVPQSQSEVMCAALTGQGCRTAGPATFDALRIEAGFPLYGIDMTDANLAQEVSRTERAISFTKGCYLGQEPIARIDALGHVNQELRGLLLEGLRVPPAGSPILSPGDAAVIGRVTSSAIDSRGERCVALGYLRRGHTTPGTRVEVQLEAERLAAVVYWPTR